MDAPIHNLPAARSFSHTYAAADEAATGALGRRIGRGLAGGEIILLYGELGMGKTCLVQGVCAALDVGDEVVSPTFTLVNTYAGRLRVHHLDFYRVASGHDLNDIGVPEILDEIWDGGAVGLVEWPGPLLPALGAAPHLALLATPGADPGARLWHLRGVPEVPPSWRKIFADEGSATC